MQLELLNAARIEELSVQTMRSGAPAVCRRESEEAPWPSPGNPITASWGGLKTTAPCWFRRPRGGGKDYFSSSLAGVWCSPEGGRVTFLLFGFIRHPAKRAGSWFTLMSKANEVSVCVLVSSEDKRPPLVFINIEPASPVAW